MTRFVDEQGPPGNWRAAERLVCRFLLHSRFTAIRLVGQSSDGGADIVATTPAGLRAVVQVKHWNRPVGLTTRDETIRALGLYRASIPIIVAFGGFDEAIRRAAVTDHAHGTKLQLWDWSHLLTRAASFPDVYPLGDPSEVFAARSYQEVAIEAVLAMFHSEHANRGMVVLATGLGKTFVAAEALRRSQASRRWKVLVLAHTNELVYQLERAFWPFLKASQSTIVWNGVERAGIEDLAKADMTFACVDSVFGYIDSGGELPEYDLVLIDECHHAAASMYREVIAHTRAGASSGPKLLGLTATPWHPGDLHLDEVMGDTLVSVDILTGLREGYLSNVDYRMFTDNIDWTKLKELSGERLSPRQINRTLFIQEWDDAVVDALQTVWSEVARPRAIVFCGTVDHAIIMRDKIRARGFANPGALYSQAAGASMKPYERNRLLCDFHDGAVDVVCAVDILNEGVDVPDVNIVVFQRVTHSRRIFVQQLGRGLRLSPDKHRVVVLDFVSDIRRFAAGFSLQRAIGGRPASGGSQRVRLNHRVQFQRAGHSDGKGESFLREWLADLAEVEGAPEDVAVLKFPPLYDELNATR